MLGRMIIFCCERLQNLLCNSWTYKPAGTLWWTVVSVFCGSMTRFVLLKFGQCPNSSICPSNGLTCSIVCSRDCTNYDCLNSSLFRSVFTWLILIVTVPDVLYNVGYGTGGRASFLSSLVIESLISKRVIKNMSWLFILRSLIICDLPFTFQKSVSVSQRISPPCSRTVQNQP